MTAQILIFLAFFSAFAVKVPMWPVHTWLPDAHVEAPTGGSVVLAAIMLKMGGYGFLRLSLPIAPDASRELDWLIIALSLIAVLYIAFVALAQQDMKKLIAYSSIAHMGFVTLGAFIGFRIMANTGASTGIEMGLDGAMVQMISHGLVSGAMFLCVGVMYDRVHSREISAYGGVINTMPKFAAFMVLFALANSGLPGTSGFHRRVHGDTGRPSRRTSGMRFPGGDHPGSGRRVHPVADQARHFRPGRQRRRSRRSRISGCGRESLVLGALAAGGAAGRIHMAGATARCDAGVHAALGPAAAGLEDRSLRPNDARSRSMSAPASSTPDWSMQRPEIFLALAACAILMLDLVLSTSRSGVGPSVWAVSPPCSSQPGSWPQQPGIRGSASWRWAGMFEGSTAWHKC